jgi:hypothetical protein
MSTSQLRAFLATERQTKVRTLVRSGQYTDPFNTSTFCYSKTEFPLTGKSEFANVPLSLLLPLLLLLLLLMPLLMLPLLGRCS